jgi:hypothetical protein
MVLSRLSGRTLKLQVHNTESGTHTSRRILLPLALLTVLSLAACGEKKVDIKTGLSELEQAFPATAPSAATGQTQPAIPLETATDTQVAVRSAVAAVRTNDCVKGVVALERIEQTRGVTADQLMAIARAKQAIMTDLISRAARGDANAQAQLAAIEKTRSQ